MCLHHMTGVSPININIGKVHSRVICQCGPAAVTKLQFPSCLNRLGWGSCNLATAAEPHRLCKTAIPIQECCTTCGPPAADLPHNSVSSRSPHNSASSTDVLSYSAPITMKDTVLIVLSLVCFVVERYHSVP